MTALNFVPALRMGAAGVADRYVIFIVHVLAGAFAFLAGLFDFHKIYLNRISRAELKRMSKSGTAWKNAA